MARRALATGTELAAEVLRFRRSRLARRAVAVRARAAAERVAAVPPVDARLVRAVGAPLTSGTLVAEGDSWFDYPWHDVLRMLEDEHGYDVESVAHKGDRVEEMAYSGGQLEELTRLIEKLLRRGQVPKAILLSGGGNDVAGDEFAMLLEHAKSPRPGLNDQVVAGIVDERIRLAYVTMLSAISTLCRERLGRVVPILVHGYDYAVPDGRGFLGGWWLLPGPWMEPGFREKGYEAMAARKQIVQTLIDRFNRMLAKVAAMPDFAHVRHVDLRRTLPNGSTYKDWWANELHPTEQGFARVAAEFARAIG